MKTAEKETLGKLVKKNECVHINTLAVKAKGMLIRRK